MISYENSNVAQNEKIGSTYDKEARLITLQEMQETFEIVIKEVMDNDGNGK